MMAQDSCIVRDILADKVGLLQEWLSPSGAFLEKLCDRGILDNADLEEIQSIRNPRRRVLNLVCTVTTTKPEDDVREFRKVICQEYPNIAKLLGVNKRHPLDPRCRSANPVVGKSSYIEIRQAEKQKRRDRSEGLKREKQKSKDYYEKWQTADAEVKRLKTKLINYLDIYKRATTDVKEEVHHKLDDESQDQKRIKSALEASHKRKTREMKHAKVELEDCEDNIVSYKKKLGLLANARRKEVERQLNLVCQKDDSQKERLETPYWKARDRADELIDTIERLENEKEQVSGQISERKASCEAVAEIIKYSGGSDRKNNAARGQSSSGSKQANNRDSNRSSNAGQTNHRTSSSTGPGNHRSNSRSSSAEQTNQRSGSSGQSNQRSGSVGPSQTSPSNKQSGSSLSPKNQQTGPSSSNQYSGATNNSRESPSPINQK